MSKPLLQVINFKKQIKVGGNVLGLSQHKVHAVDDVSFELHTGETLSIVGESGCGKSTVAPTVLGLTDATAGEVYLDGVRIDNLSRRDLLPTRKRMQLIFQDPFSSLNPKTRVRAILAEPLRHFGLVRTDEEIEERIGELVDMVQCHATQCRATRTSSLAGSDSGSASPRLLPPSPTSSSAMNPCRRSTCR